LEKFVKSSSEEELREELRSWLKAKGFGEYTVNKTALQLQRSVGYRSILSRDELEELYSLMISLPSDQRDALRFQMLLRTNRFLLNLYEAMKRASLNGASDLTAQQLYDRLQAEYGYRGMIPRRVRYALQTMKSFGVVQHHGSKWSLIR
jgi:hypothetical protein